MQNGDRPLHKAAMNGRIDAVKVLTELGAYLSASNKASSCNSFLKEMYCIINNHH